MTEAAEFDIVRIGAHGDGVAETPRGPVYVPYALPGERWLIGAGPDPVRIGDAAPGRRAPDCPHFGVCGGCIAQHMPEADYLAWKRALVADALALSGIEAPVAATIPSGPRSRRRAVLAAVRSGGGVQLGFHARRSNEVVPVRACAVIVPEIERRWPGLEAIAARLVPKRGELRMTVVATDTGLDVDVVDAGRVPDAADHAALSVMAQAHGVARLVVDGRDVVRFAEPTLTVDDVAVVPPGGGFLQASAVAEVHMIDLVLAACGRAKRVADLFCGSGTFALAVSRSGRVSAFDADAPAIAALDRAARHTQGRKAIETTVRDLFREPLSRKELEPFDAVVLDPPRAGAKAQCEALAKSKVPVIAAVSCNPATFARDARILIDGGYVLETVVPVDQFVWSEHVEIVATLRRPSARRR